MTGLLVEFVYIDFTGAMLGMTTPIFTITGLVTGPLYSIGPSLLFLSGIATIGANVRRSWLCLAAGSAVVIILATWTIPRIGWRYAAWLILEPVALSLLAAWFILYLVKKRWITTLIGSGLSAPFCVFGGAYVLYQNIFGTSPFSSRELVLVVPGAFVIFSFLSALRFRNN